MRRRFFLAATAAATLSVCQPLWAKTNRRKLALLVGINQYSNKAWELGGALTDLQLQREVLNYRLGFDAITTLADTAASRSAIETAFQEHLIATAQPDDVIVFHFSGQGRRVKTLNGVMPSLITASSSASICDDLSLESLYTLVQALPTPHVYIVLDCGFNPIAAGNFTSRSPLGSAEPPILGAAALEATQKISQTYRLAKISGLGTLAGIPQGTLLAASSTSAVEGYWPGFQAGVWTYALTRSLWADPSPTWVDTAIQQTVRLAHQDPYIVGKELNLAESQRSMIGRVSGIENDKTQVWLGGLTATAGSRLQTFTAAGETLELIVRSPSGLSIKAEAADAEQVPALDAPVREVERLLTPVRLRVGLAAEIERIERVDITSALSQLRVGEDWNLIEPDALHDRAVDCVLGKANGSYGLFWPNREVIARSFGTNGEAAKAAVQRLHSQMQHLLAAKRLDLLLNGATTKLDFEMTLTSGDHYSQSQPSRHAPNLAKLTYTPHLQTKAGDTLSVNLTNFDSESLSVCLLSQDRAGILTVFAEPIMLQTRHSVSLVATAPTGLTTLYAIATQRPLTTITSQLQELAQRTGVSSTCIALPQPLDFIQALWQDLASHAGSEPHTLAFDLQTWIAVALPYDVV